MSANNSSRVERRFRSLAEELRARTADELTELLEARADLIDPVPTSMGELASRCGSSESVRAAVDWLEADELGALVDLCRAQGDSSNLDPATVARLWARGLIWMDSMPNSTGRYHVVSSARHLLSGVNGSVPQRGPSPAPETPVWELPAGVALTSRGPAERSLAGSWVASQQAASMTDRITTLLEFWRIHPARKTKAKVVTARSVADATEVLALGTGPTAEHAGSFIIDLVGMCGFTSSDLDSTGHHIITASASYRAWREMPLAEQWTQLVMRWYQADRDTRLLASAGPDGRRMSPLTSTLDKPGLARLRQLVLTTLATLGPDQMYDADELVAVIRATCEARGINWGAELASVTLTECELLGLVAGSATTTSLCALATGDPAAVLDSAVQSLAAEVDRFIAQGDLTVVVPGPPSVALRRLLIDATDRESGGLAHVARISSTTIERAAVRGWTQEQLLEAFTTHAEHDLPQAIRYLINDTYRQVSRIPDTATRATTTRRASDHHVDTYAHVRATAESVPVAVIAQSLLEADGAAAPRDSTVPGEGPADGAETLRMSPAQVALALARSLGQERAVRIGYANNAGSVFHRLARVLSIDPGSVTIADPTSSDTVTIAKARIVSVEAFENPASTAERLPETTAR